MRLTGKITYTFIPVQVVTHQHPAKSKAVKKTHKAKVPNLGTWKCKAVEASTDLAVSPCRLKASAPACPDSTAYQNASPKKPGSVSQTRPSIPCTRRGKAGPLMRSPWESCRVTSPGTHRKHREPCSKLVWLLRARQYGRYLGFASGKLPKPWIRDGGTAAFALVS